MKKKSILIVLASVILLVNNSNAKDLLFLPANNQSISSDSNSSSSQLVYGLTDEEISRRVKEGRTNTVPLSVLITWEENQQKNKVQQTVETNKNSTDNSQSLSFERTKSVSNQDFQNTNVISSTQIPVVAQTNITDGEDKEATRNSAIVNSSNDIEGLQPDDMLNNE